MSRLSVSARRPWQGLRLGDPAGDLGLARHAPDDVGRAATTSWNVSRGWRRCAAPARRGVHAGRLEEVRVLGADALDAHQVDVVHPLEDELAADAGRGLERLPAGLVGAPWSRSSVVTPASASLAAWSRRCPRSRRSSSLILPPCRPTRPGRPMIRLPAPPNTLRPGGPMDKAFHDAMTAGYALTEPASSSAARCSTASSPTTPASRSRCRCSTATA